VDFAAQSPVIRLGPKQDDDAVHWHAVIVEQRRIVEELAGVVGWTALEIEIDDPGRRLALGQHNVGGCAHRGQIDVEQLYRFVAVQAKQRLKIAQVGLDQILERGIKLLGHEGVPRTGAFSQLGIPTKKFLPGTIASAKMVW